MRAGENDELFQAAEGEHLLLLAISQELTAKVGCQYIGTYEADATSSAGEFCLQRIAIL